MCRLSNHGLKHSPPALQFAGGISPRLCGYAPRSRRWPSIFRGYHRQPPANGFPQWCRVSGDESLPIPDIPWVQHRLRARENLPDPLDRAVAESDRNWTLRIRDRESMLIKKIRNSLEAIENEEYGVCEDCGEDISIERLKARPVTSFCIRCKTKRESLEKLTGT